MHFWLAIFMSVADFFSQCVYDSLFSHHRDSLFPIALPMEYVVKYLEFYHSSRLFIYLILLILGNYLCNYFWLPWVSAAAWGLSLTEVSRGYSSLQFLGFSLWWRLLWSADSRCVDDIAVLPGSGAWARRLRSTGLIALQQVEPSWTRDRTCVPCTSRRILIHCTAREVLIGFFFKWCLGVVFVCYPQL